MITVQSLFIRYPNFMSTDVTFIFFLSNFPSLSLFFQHQFYGETNKLSTAYNYFDHSNLIHGVHTKGAMNQSGWACHRDLIWVQKLYHCDICLRSCIGILRLVYWGCYTNTLRLVYWSSYTGNVIPIFAYWYTDAGLLETSYCVW